MHEIKTFLDILIVEDRVEAPLRDKGDRAVLHVKDVGVDLEKGDQILRRLEKVPTAVLAVLVDSHVEELLHVDLARQLDPLPEELDELVGEHGVDLHLLRLPTYKMSLFS